MMEAVHATEEWQRAGVHYIRIQAMCVGFDIPLKYEFADDTKDSEYILVHENGFPVSTCRVRINEENAGHIERVATLEEYRGKHYGALGIKAAEQLFPGGQYQVIRKKGAVRNQYTKCRHNRYLLLDGLFYGGFPIRP